MILKKDTQITHTFLVFGVGNKVWRYVASVKLHSFNHFELILQCLSNLIDAMGDVFSKSKNCFTEFSLLKNTSIEAKILLIHIIIDASEKIISINIDIVIINNNKNHAQIHRRCLHLQKSYQKIKN